MILRFEGAKVPPCRSVIVRDLKWPKVVFYRTIHGPNTSLMFSSSIFSVLGLFVVVLNLGALGANGNSFLKTIQEPGMHKKTFSNRPNG